VVGGRGAENSLEKEEKEVDENEGGIGTRTREGSGKVRSKLA
jgi:hypothetical protein